MSVIVAHLATTVFYASPHFLVTHGGALTTLPHHLSLSPHHRATLVIFLGYCFFITKKGSISSPLTRHAQRGEHTERQTDTDRENTEDYCEMRLLSILFGFTRAIDWLSFHQDPTKGCDNLRSDGERAGRLHFCQREEPLLIQAVVTAAVQTKHACEVCV